MSHHCDHPDPDPTFTLVYNEKGEPILELVDNMPKPKVKLIGYVCRKEGCGQRLSKDKQPLYR